MSSASSELSLFSRRKFRDLPVRQASRSINTLYYETAFCDPSHVEVFVYTDRLSYMPGDAVRIYASSTAKSFSIDIVKDGAKPVVVCTLGGLCAPSAPVPDAFERTGCDWPQVKIWQVPNDAEPGFYIFRSSAADGEGGVRQQEHGIFVRRSAGTTPPILMIASTSTWIAYNDWGGRSHYVAQGKPDGFNFSPVLSIHRPWARGFITLPAGAPRKTEAFSGELGSMVRYPVDEFAYAHGYSKFYASAGWASFNRPMLIWAEQNGFAMDVTSQHDLHAQHDLLDRYKCIVLAGHDEYWTWEMREALESYIAKGGRICRLAGDFSAQVRLSDDLTKQYHYKDAAAKIDPVVGTTADRRRANLWCDPAVDWPAEETFGSSSIYGIYAGVGGLGRRGGRGFTVYRPDHWAFSGLALGYGDEIGASSSVFGYEVDGLDIDLIEGLPYPTSKMRVPSGLEILAMGLASNVEVASGAPGETLYYGNYGPAMSKLRESAGMTDGARGNGVIVSFSKGSGQVFSVGSCEWVNGLIRNDPIVSGITRNILGQFTN